MNLCYADPPYPGQAKKHYSHDPLCAEVDHKVLISRLCGCDAWALSTGSVNLREILPLCPPEARIAAWVKPFGSFKPNVNPAYVWEPVLFVGPKLSRDVATVRDFFIGDEAEPAIAESITLRRGLAGAKPERFCFWIFDLLGAMPGDELVDLFPGTGGVTTAWEKWRAQKLGNHPVGSLFAGGRV